MTKLPTPIFWILMTRVVWYININIASFMLWKFGILSFVWPWFHVIIPIYLKTAAIWKKNHKICVLLLSKTGQFWAFLKNAWLWEAVVSKPLNHRKLRVISGKIVSLSFIWCLVVACMTTGLVTGLVWKLAPSCKKTFSRRGDVFSMNELTIPNSPCLVSCNWN